MTLLVDARIPISAQVSKDLTMLQLPSEVPAGVEDANGLCSLALVLMSDFRERAFRRLRRAAVAAAA